MAASEYGLSIVLDFQDRASSGIQKTIGLFQNLTGTVNSLTKGFGSTGDTLWGLNSSIVGMSVMGNQFKNIGTDIYSTMGKVGSNVMETGSTFENFRITLGALYDSTEAADEEISKLFDYAVKSPYMVKDLQNVMITFKSLGLEAFDEVTNASTGFSESLMDWLGDLQSFRPGEAASRWRRAIQNFLSGTTTQSALVMRNLLDVGDLATFIGHDLGDTVEERVQSLTDIVTKLNLQGLQNKVAHTWTITLSNMQDAWDKFAYEIGVGNKQSKFYTLGVQAAQNLLQVEQDILGNKKVVEATAKSFESLIKPIERVTYVLTLFSPAIAEWLGRHPELFTFAEGLAAISGAGLITTGVLLQVSGSVLNWVNNVQRLGGLATILNAVSTASRVAAFNFMKFSAVPALGIMAYSGNWFGLKDFLTDSGGQVGNLINKIGELMNGNKEEGKDPMTFRQALDASGLKTFRTGLDDLSSSLKNLGSMFYEGVRGFFSFFGVDLPIYTKETFNLTKVLNDLGKTLTEKFSGESFKQFSEKHGTLIKTLGGITAGLMTAFAASSLLKIGMLILKTTVVDTISTFGMLMKTLATPAGMLGLGMAGLYAGYQYNFLGLHDSLQRPVSEIMQARDLLIEMSTGYGPKSKALVEEYGLRDFAEGLLGVKDTLSTLKNEFLSGFLGAGGSFGGLFGGLIEVLIGGGSVTDALNTFGNALKKLHENTAFNGVLAQAANLLGTIASAATTAGGSMILIGGLVGTVFVPLISSLTTVGSLMLSALVSPFGLATVALTAYATNFGGLKDKVDGTISLYKSLRGFYRTFKEDGTLDGKKISKDEFLSLGYDDRQYEFLGDNRINFGDINNIFDLLDSKKTIFKAFTDGLKDGLMSVFSSVKSLVSALLGIPDVPLLDWIKKLNSYLGELGIAKITDKASDLGKTVGELAGKIGLLLPLVSVVGKLGTAMEKTFGVKVSPLTAGLKLVNDGFKMITSGASEMKNAVVGALKSMISYAKSFYTTLLGNKVGYLKNFFGNTANTFFYGANGAFARTLGYTGLNPGGLFNFGGGSGTGGSVPGGYFSLFPTTTLGFAQSLVRMNPYMSGNRFLSGLQSRMASYVADYLPQILRDDDGTFLGYGTPRRNMINDLQNRHSLNSWLSLTPYSISERFKNSYLGRSFEAARLYDSPSNWSSRRFPLALSKSSDLGSFLVSEEARYNNKVNSIRPGTSYAKEISYLNGKRGRYTQSLITKLESAGLASRYTSMRNGRRVIDASQIRSLYSDFYTANMPTQGNYGKLNSLSKYLVNPEGRTKAFMRLMRMKVSNGGISALFPSLLKGLSGLATGVATFAPAIVMGYSKILFSLQMFKMQMGTQVFMSLVSSLGQLAMGATKVALGFTKMSVGLSLISLGVLTFGTMATSEWKGLTEAIKEQETPLGKIKAAYDWFTEHLSANISKLTEKIEKFDVSAFIQKVMGVAGTLGDTILAIVGGSNGDNGMAELLASMFDGLLSGINEGSKVSGKLFNVLSGIFNSSMQSLRNHIPSIGASIRGILFNALQFAAMNIDSLVSTVGQLLVSLFDVQDPDKVADLGVRIINSILNGIIEYAPKIIEGADEVVSNFLKKLDNQQTKDKLIMAGRTLIYHLGNSIKENGQLLWDLAVPVFKGLWKDIVATFADGIADCMFKIAAFSGILGVFLTLVGGVTGNSLALGTGIALDALAVGMGVGGLYVKGYGEESKAEVEKSLYGGHSSRLATLEDLFVGGNRSPSETSEFYPGYSPYIEGTHDEPKQEAAPEVRSPGESFYTFGAGVFTGQDHTMFNPNTENFSEFLDSAGSYPKQIRLDKHTTNSDGSVSVQAGHVVSVPSNKKFVGYDSETKEAVYEQTYNYYWTPGYKEDSAPINEESAVKKGTLVGSKTGTSTQVQTIEPKVAEEPEVVEVPVTVQPTVTEIGEPQYSEGVDYQFELYGRELSENTEPVTVDVPVQPEFKIAYPGEAPEASWFDTRPYPNHKGDILENKEQIQNWITEATDYVKTLAEGSEERVNIEKEIKVNMDYVIISDESEEIRDKRIAGIENFFKRTWNGLKSLFTRKEEEINESAQEYTVKYGVKVNVNDTEIEGSTKKVDELKQSISGVPEEPKSNFTVEVDDEAFNTAKKALETVNGNTYTTDFIINKKTVETTVSGNSVDNNATGTNNWRGGLTWVHESGPEIIDLPSGARVVPRAKSLVEMYNRGLEDGYVEDSSADIDDVFTSPEPTAAQIIQSVTQVATAPVQTVTAPSTPSQDSYDYSVNFNSGSIVIHVDNANGDSDYEAAAEKIMYYIAKKQKRMTMARR